MTTVSPSALATPKTWFIAIIDPAPGHVLNYEIGISRHVKRHEAGEQSRPAIVEPARRQADDDADGLTLVEGFVLRFDVAGAEKIPSQSAAEKNRFGVFSSQSWRFPYPVRLVGENVFHPVDDVARLIH